MSDDTTTWLKKNPSINPLRRSLKTSLRFNVPSTDMNTSILSNPDNVKDQGLFIPRMMQRNKMQMRKSRAHEFKIPEMMPSKPPVKKENSGSGAKQRKVPTPNKTRKSFLPVPKTAKPPSNEKPAPKPNAPRPSFIPPKVVSGRRTTAKRELIKKVVELSEIKRKEEAESQSKVVSGDSSVLRSILKKRASLRRSSQLSANKPKAKKVLFDGFENSDGEKENEINISLEDQNDFNTALDEPTVFLNFPNGTDPDDSFFEPAKPLNWTVEETKIPQSADIDHIVKLWESYKENLDTIQTERLSLEDSFESLLKHSLDFQKQYQSYKESSEELYSRLSQLGVEIETKLRKVISETSEVRESTPASSKKSFRKSERIRLSDKSKMIKKHSARKSMPILKNKYLNMDDSFSIISKGGFFDK